MSPGIARVNFLVLILQRRRSEQAALSMACRFPGVAGGIGGAGGTTGHRPVADLNRSFFAVHRQTAVGLLY